METPLWFWIAFNAIVLVILAMDLGVFHRDVRPVTMKEAGTWTAVFISLSMLFAAGVWHLYGRAKGMEFLTGYVIEYALSVDNIFVFIIIFSFFKVPAAYQHRVLVWGVLLALVMRGAMIWVGVALIERFAWIMYVFGAFLVVTGARMLFHKPDEMHPDENPAIRFCRRVLPISHEYEGSHFISRKHERFMFTPLFLVFVVINVTDVIFAVDSIPAIFGITVDPFMVYTSNICAILGLRSLYFLLAGVMNLFVYLPTGLALVLMFVGGKMVAEKFIHINTPTSLAVITAILGISVAASLVAQRRK